MHVNVSKQYRPCGSTSVRAEVSKWVIRSVARIAVLRFRTAALATVRTAVKAVKIYKSIVLSLARKPKKAALLTATAARKAARLIANAARNVTPAASKPVLLTVMHSVYIVRGVSVHGWFLVVVGRQGKQGNQGHQGRSRQSRPRWGHQGRSRQRQYYRYQSKSRSQSQELFNGNWEMLGLTTERKQELKWYIYIYIIYTEL